MEQNSENKIELKSKLVSFYNYNKLRILIFFLLIFIAIFTLFFINYKNENKNIRIAEKYVEAVIHLSANNKNDARIIFEEIILSKNKFYSLIALNNIIEKELFEDKDKILNYFEILEKSNINSETKDLLVFKKALFLIKNSEINEGKNLLKGLIDKSSNLKILAEELLKE